MTCKYCKLQPGPVTMSNLGIICCGDCNTDNQLPSPQEATYNGLLQFNKMWMHAFWLDIPFICSGCGLERLQVLFYCEDDGMMIPSQFINEMIGENNE